MTARDREQLGLLAAGLARGPRASSSWWTAWSPRRRSGAAKPEPAGVRARARARGGRPRRGGARGRHARQRHRGRRGGRACAAVLLQREGDPPPAGGVDPLASRAARPTLTARAARRVRSATPAAAGPPELPEGAAPRWPAWYAGRGLPRGADRDADRRGHRRGRHRAPTPDDEDPTFTVVATFLQGADLHRHGGAVRLVHAEAAGRALRPAAHPLLAGGRLGGARDVQLLRRSRRSTRRRPARRRADGRPGPRRRPGHVRADRRRLHGRSASRRSPRSSSSAASSTRRCGAAARSSSRRASTASLFGVIHYDFSGADALLILPPLGVLGFIFCLVYERTGSIYPMIALHAFNNAIAFGVDRRGRLRVARPGPADAARAALTFREHSGRPWHSGRHMKHRFSRSRWS